MAGSVHADISSDFTFGETKKAQRETFWWRQTNHFLHIATDIIAEVFICTFAMFISHLESLGGQALCMSVGVGESWSSAAAPFSGTPRCQFNQPNSVILWHLCEHTHARAHPPPPPGYGWANDSSPCSPPSLSVSLFLCLSPSVQETSLRRAMRRKEASCWRRSSHRSKVRHSGLQEIYCPEQISLLWLAVGRGVNNLSWLEWKERFTVIYFFLEKQTYLLLAKANLHRTPAETKRE